MIRREKSEFMQVMEELTRQGIKGEELDKELAIRFCNTLFFKRLMKDCVGSLGDEDD